jgi:hypothetical protein
MVLAAIGIQLIFTAVLSERAAAERRRTLNGYRAPVYLDCDICGGFDEGLADVWAS